MIHNNCEHCPKHCPRPKWRGSRSLINLIALLALSAACGQAKTDLPQEARGVYEGRWQDGSPGEADVLKWMLDDRYHLSFRDPEGNVCSSAVDVYSAGDGWDLVGWSRGGACNDSFDARIEPAAGGYRLSWDGERTAFEGRR